MRRLSLPVSVVALVLLAPLALGQPAKGAAGAQDVAGAKILRVQWQGFPETFDPQQTLYGDGIGVSGLDYEGLTRIDEEMNTVPGAAESWAFSADGLVLTFTLRSNLTYADGSPLTA